MAKTKLKLQFPYSEHFKSGFLNINKEPRRVVSLIRMDGTRTSTSYARYLMSCNLGRYLNSDEDVDHIDNDKMNDDISNLQILSTLDNNRKRNLSLGITKNFVELYCPICEVKFERDVRNVNHKLSNGKKITCSKKCGGKMSHLTKNGLVSPRTHNA